MKSKNENSIDKVENKDASTDQVKITNNNLNDKQEKQTSQISKRKKLPKWKLITIISCIAVVLIGSTLGLIFGLMGSLDLDKMYIANFSSYSGLGAGYINATSNGQVSNGGKLNLLSKNGNVNLGSNDTQNESFLVGRKPDGTVEKLAFSKTQNGKPEKQQDRHINAILSLSNFTFFQTSNEKYFNSNTFEINSNPFGCKPYVIAHKTGKIYNLKIKNIERESFFIDNSCIGVSPFNVDIKNSYNSYFIKSKYNLESEVCSYFYYNGEKDWAFYKMKIENDELKLEEILSCENIEKLKISPNFVFTDKYGNFYACGEEESGTRKPIIKYIIKENGEFVSHLNGEYSNIIDQEYIFAVNGIVYTKDKNYKMDANGNLVANTFTNCELSIRKENIIKTDGNVTYYYGGRIQDSSYSTQGGYCGDKAITLDTIYKVTFAENDEFTYEAIPVGGYSKNYVVTQDKIYFYNEQKVFSVDIKTGVKTDLVSNYVFSGISTDNLGNVLFTGLDNRMNNINGTIFNDGSIEVLTTKRKYVVFSLKAIN